MTGPGRDPEIGMRKDHEARTIPPLAVVHGRNVPLQRLHWLNTGPLTVALDGIDIRYVKLGDLELVRRIYMGVRDPNWNTIPARVFQLDVDERPESFDVHLSAGHEATTSTFLGVATSPALQMATSLSSSRAAPKAICSTTGLAFVCSTHGGRALGVLSGARLRRDP